MNRFHGKFLHSLPPGFTEQTKLAPRSPFKPVATETCVISQQFHRISNAAGAYRKPEALFWVWCQGIESQEASAFIVKLAASSIEMQIKPTLQVYEVDTAHCFVLCYPEGIAETL
eukprot:scaffold302136_cov14-Prasinocladus_malaysianus.AAC.1